MSNTVLTGDLKFLNLGEIIQLLGTNSSTGVLRLTSKYTSEPGLVYVAKGNPVDASAGSLVGLDAVNSLFGWVDGTFEFNEQNVNSENVIKKSRMELILDGLSLLDDGQVEVLGPVSYDKEPSEKGDILPIIRGPLVDYMYVVDEEQYYQGSEIAVEGKHGSWVWVVLEGVVDIIKKTPKGPLTLLRIGEGAFIGSLASFSMGGYVRSASAVASQQLQLGVLDSQRLSTEYTRMPSALRSVAMSLDTRLKEVTHRIAEFHSKKHSLKEYKKEYVQGKKTIIKQGKKDERLLSITQGEAYVVRQMDNIYVPLATLREGDYFGHVSFLDIGHEPYSASVFGSESLETRPVDSESLQEGFDQISTTLKNIIEHTATSLSVTTKIACDFHKKPGPKNKEKSKS
ncbi:cyclic nucleotide-binding domain-containing protein [Thermodesulfobacteriota bacterium]